MNIKCLFGLHNWTKWTDPFPAKFTAVWIWRKEKKVNGFVQSRECKRCNKFEIQKST